MKVSGPSRSTPSQPGRGSAGTASGGFSIAGTGSSAPAAKAAATSATAGVAGVSALMALQAVDDPLERRRRNIRRGTGLLDRLDELKLALLSGESGQGALEGLRRGLAQAREAFPEPDLDAVLEQIDLRAQVELAKAEMTRRAAEGSAA